MASKRHKAEEIITKLRQVDVLLVTAKLQRALRQSPAR